MLAVLEGLAAGVSVTLLPYCKPPLHTGDFGKNAAKKPTRRPKCVPGEDRREPCSESVAARILCFATRRRKEQLRMADAHVYAKTDRTCGLAIASLILSCLTVVLGPFGCIPGIICGHLARAECRRDRALMGDGLAVAGLIIGYLFLALGLFAAFLLFLFTGNADPGIVR